MLRVAALCAGYGGLEMGLALAGVGHELAWYSEIDPHASAVMALHHSAAPNLGDLRDITDPPPVDVVTAGFPCQPVSTAGARLGVDDERWLIRDVVSVWRASGARWLVLENVWGLLTANDGRAFGEVLDALAAVGATARWACVRASDVGAPHRRTRWFCVAHPHGQGWEGEGHPQPPGRHGAGLSGRPPFDPPHRPQPVEQGGSDRLGPLDRPISGASPGTGAGDTPQGVRRLESGAGVAQCFGPYAGAVHRWEHTLGRPAPHPTIDIRLNPQFVEWMMGLPSGWVTGCGLSRTQAIRVLGNGVVPQQAAHAIRMLAAEG